MFKSGNSSDVSNYRPISLICSIAKVLERLGLKHLFNHFRDNYTLSPLQSEFIPNDSTTNQLIFLYDTFCSALDSGREIHTLLCDISKAFDRVWHKGLIAKLAANGIHVDLLSWLTSYLSNRQQRVVLPGATSQWRNVKAGVPQGSILGPLLFLLYINDIVKDIQTNIRLFADDTSLFIIVYNPHRASELLNADLSKIEDWACKWLVNFNPEKTKSMVISRKINKPHHPLIVFKKQPINQVDTHKHLGLIFASDGSWHNHIEYIMSKAWQRINVMRKLKYQLDRRSLEIIYLSFIRPILEYGDVVWCNITQRDKDELDKIQNEAARIATGATKLISIAKLYEEVGWESLETRRLNRCLTNFYKLYHGLSPSYLSSLIPVPLENPFRLRNADDVRTIRCRTNLYHESFLPSSIRHWNNLENTIRNAPSTSCFKRRLKPQFKDTI